MALVDKKTGQSTREELQQNQLSEVQELQSMVQTLEKKVQEQSQTIEDLELQNQLANEQIEMLANSDKELKKADKLKKESEQLKAEAKREAEDYTSKLHSREYELNRKIKAYNEDKERLDKIIEDKVTWAEKSYRWEYNARFGAISLYGVFVTVLLLSHHMGIFGALKGIWLSVLELAKEIPISNSLLHTVASYGGAVLLVALMIVAEFMVFQKLREIYDISMVHPAYILPIGLYIQFYERLTKWLPLGAFLFVHWFILFIWLVVEGFKRR